MYKRIITLLTTMLIITLGTFYPINVYASEDIEIDEDYDDSYVDDVTTVDIDYDTRLRTSDYYGIKYQTVVNCNFRSTDDRYYSYNIFGVRSASEWWTFHTKMGGTWNEEYGTFGYMTKWPTGEDRFLATSAKIIGEQDYNMKTNMENYLSNIRRVNTPNASNETFKKILVYAYNDMQYGVKKTTIDKMEFNPDADYLWNNIWSMFEDLAKSNINNDLVLKISNIIKRIKERYTSIN